MRARSIALLGIAAYAVFLLATMPARWALSQLALPPALVLSDVSGTVWRGAAQASVAPGASDGAAELRWHFLPARLVSGRLAFALEASGPALDGRAEIARAVGGFEAHGVSARGDASRIAAEAAGYKAERIARAKGDAERFDLLLKEYKAAPEVTRKRLWLETMEQVMAGNRKVIDGSSGRTIINLPPATPASPAAATVTTDDASDKGNQP
jgi:hypothetical protein